MLDRLFEAADRRSTCWFVGDEMRGLAQFPHSGPHTAPLLSGTENTGHINNTITNNKKSTKMTAP